MIMEDVVARGADPRDSTRPMTVEQVANGVRGLARMHSQFWGERLTANSGAGLARAVRRIRKGWSTPRCTSRTSDWATTVSPEILAFSGTDLFVDIWARYIGTLTGSSTSSPTLLHGDPHIGNTYVLPDDEVGFLDWQMARRGNWSLDLGYFLQGALTIEDRRRAERDLLDEYRGALALPSSELPSAEERLVTVSRLGRAWPRDLDGDPVRRRRLAGCGYLPGVGAAVRGRVRRPRHPRRARRADIASAGSPLQNNIRMPDSWTAAASGTL